MSGKTVFFILFTIVLVATIYTLVEEKKENIDHSLTSEEEGELINID